MDIYSEKGTKVKFIEDDVSQEQINFANCDNPKGILKFNEEYTIDKTFVFNWYTVIYLEEFPGKSFNSIWFE